MASDSKLKALLTGGLGSKKQRIFYRQGNFVRAFNEGSIDAIGIGHNCLKQFINPIARQLVELYPEVQANDSTIETGDRDMLGLIMPTIVDVKGTNANISLLYIQEKYNFESRSELDKDYGLIEQFALEDSFRTFLTKHRKHRVAIPQIGIGSSGVKWEIVEALLESLCEELDMTISVYMAPKRKNTGGKNGNSTSAQKSNAHSKNSSKRKA